MKKKITPAKALTYVVLTYTGMIVENTGNIMPAIIRLYKKFRRRKR